jgi:SSS family solute:Na+ symporter
MRDQLPILLGNKYGNLLGSLLIVAVMAAAMSTADSSLHALSALMTHDVYDRFVRPQGSETERIWVGRLVILVATLISLSAVLGGSRDGSRLAGMMQTIVNLGLFAAAFSVQLLPMTIDVLFVRRATKAGACTGLAVGLLLAFAFTSLFPPLAESARLDGLVALVNRAKTLFPVHASLWGLIPNVAALCLVSAITKRPSKDVRNRFAADFRGG